MIDSPIYFSPGANLIPNSSKSNTVNATQRNKVIAVAVLVFTALVLLTLVGMGIAAPILTATATLTLSPTIVALAAMVGTLAFAILAYGCYKFCTRRKKKNKPMQPIKPALPSTTSTTSTTSTALTTSTTSATSTASTALTASATSAARTTSAASAASAAPTPATLSAPKHSIAASSISPAELAIIQKKRVLIEKAIKVFERRYIKTNTIQYMEEKVAVTALKVQSYFEHRRDQLDQGINVPMPDFYHCTRTFKDMTNIINDQFIKTTCPVSREGRGAFISSKIEWQQFGKYAFAIDQSAIANTQGHCFKPWGRKFPDGPNTLWVGVHDEITIIPDSVAYVILSEASEKVRDQEAASLQPILSKAGLKVDVFDRFASDLICDILNEADSARELPSPHWRGVKELARDAKYLGDKFSEYLPPNMRHWNLTWVDQIRDVEDKHLTGYHPLLVPTAP